MLPIGEVKTDWKHFSNQSSLFFCHPVFNLQAWYPFKVLDVASHKDEIFFKCSSGNEHIHIANTKALLF